MKFKFVLPLFLAGCAISVNAQGYKDGVEYYKVNQFDKAKILLQRNLNSPETDKAQSYYYLGRIAIVNNNLAEAKDYFEKGIAANASDGFNFVGLGALDLKNGNLKGAESHFKEAVDKDKKDPNIQVAIAQAYYQADAVTYAKQITKAIDKAKKIDSKNPAPYIFEGDVLATEKKWGDSAGYYEMAESFDPNCSEAYVKYANTYFYVSPEVAIKKLESLVSANPNSALAQRELAEKLYEADQWTNAAKVYGEYIKNPNHFKEDEERYAVLLYFGGKYDESYALASKLLSKNPDMFLMKRIAFISKAALKDYDGAIDVAKSFFGSTNPKDKYSANDYITYGQVLKAVNKTDEAIAQFTKALEINPDKIELLKELSSIYNQKEDYVKAAEYYQQFIDKGNYTTNDLYVLAGRYQNIVATSKNAATKNAALDSALKNIDLVIEKVPNDYRIQQRKARILMASEPSIKDGKAMGSYEKMLEILNADPANLKSNADAYKEAYNYIAGYKLETGDSAGAKVYYNKYLSLDPNNEQLRQFVNKLK